MAMNDNGELNSSNFGSNTDDPNNSILKKVTKRVSGLFPSSFTKWFNPNESNQSTVRRRESTDDDDDNLQLQQPPKKRVRPSSDVDFSSPSSFTVTSTPLVTARPTAVSYEPTSTRNEAPVVNGDDKSDSGDSTSGYSSVQPQLHKEPSFVSDGERLLNKPSTSKASPPKSINSSLNSSRSLFSEHSLSRKRQCLSNRRPSFNASTFGSPSFVDRTLSTKRAVNSPFYSGRTIYGGASAYRRNRIIFPRDESSNISAKNSIDIKPAKDSSSSTDSVNLSKTARRILDTLEHFSTPVLDAKKIPNINRQSCDTKRRTPYSREKTSAPNKELLVPTVPDLIKMKLKERLQDSTVQVRKVATSSKSVLNSEYSIRTIEEPKKHTNKMKTKVASVRQRKENLDDTVDAVKLPDVKLPITNLPKFDFALPPPAAIVTKPVVTEVLKPIISTPISKPQVASSSTEFDFTEPIFISNKSKSQASQNDFTFSEPVDAKNSASTSPTITFNVPSSNTAPRRKETPKNNGQNNIGFSIQPATHLIAGSVMDILGKPESDNLLDKFKPAAGTWECSACMIRNIPSATRCVACETLRETPKKENKNSIENKSYGFGNQFKMSSDKWECSSCMVRNNNTATKCVACATPKPGTTPVSIPSSVVSTPNTLSGFGDKFKPPSDTWECSACMIRNKKDAVKCVACETANPSAKKDNKPSDKSELKITDSGFGEMVKKQQSNWECASCMIRNPPDKKICVCCEAPKPGEQQEIKFGSQPTGGTQFKFGIDNSASSGFKFGIDKAATPATTFSFGVKPADKSTDTKAATTNGPEPVTTGFTFGIPPSKTEPKKESPVKTAVPEVSTNVEKSEPKSDANKMPFKFGTPTMTSTAGIFATKSTTISSFTFGVPATATVSSNISVPATTLTPVPVVTNQATSSKTFSFGATPTAAVTTNYAVTSTSTAKSLPPSTIFGNMPSSSRPSFTAPTVIAVTTTPTATTSTISSSTFTFGTPANTLAKSVALTSENKLPVPQFNFGPGGLPFNSVDPKVTSANTSTSAASFGSNTAFSNIAKKTEAASSFGSNQPTFTFNTSSNPNKQEVKPFAFSGSGESSSKPSTFSFTQNESSGAPLAKAPVFNFGGSNTATPMATAAPVAGMFNFSANKTDKPATSGSTIFGEPVASSSTPQNGGFNFGASSVPNFNFGGGSNSATPTPAVFGFGSSQAGTGSSSATPARASAAEPGIFAFGGGTSSQLQTQTPTFSPDIKPNFNFTGGNLPSFSAQGGPATGAMSQRKIRKAVRRTQQR